MTIHRAVDQFRLAAREVRNHFFRAEGPNPDWQHIERFDEVESALFDALVALPFGLQARQYISGNPIRGIRVRAGAPRVRAMINRVPGMTHGYWDHTVKELSRDSQLLFARFFDWDQFAVQDYQYVLVLIEGEAGVPTVTGHYALIEFGSTKFEVSDI